MLRNEKVSVLFLVLTTVFVTCLLISNIIVGKLISIFGIVLPAAVILFPLTYLFGDVLTEVYGFERTRLVIWLGFAANVFMALVILAAIRLPYPAFWRGQEAFRAVLGFTPRVVAASLAAYFVGEFTNSAVMSRMKVLTGGRWLWLRAIGSTVAGEGVDTLVFLTGAFLGVYPLATLASMICAQFLWKVLYEAAATPLTYRIVGWVKRREGLDRYDRGVSYNPFRLGVQHGQE
ncbi:MAG: queuosine precursor transporter [Bacteroidota bacterium]